MPNTVPDILNGTYEISPNPPYVATLSCNTGFKADGPVISELRQDANGTEFWDPMQLKCIPMTKNTLPTVDHGVILTAERNGMNVNAPYFMNDQVRPRCDDGYEFKGQAAILLHDQQNDTLIWVPHNLICEPMSLNEPPIAENGIVSQKGPYVLNTIVTLQCNPGYKSVPWSSSKLIVENKNLVWDPETISCEPLTLSNDPELINGIYKLPHDPPYFFGEKAEVHCYPGFESTIILSEVIQLGYKLAWSPEKLYCQPMFLNTKPVVVNGFSELQQPLQSKYYKGTKANIVCNDEHNTENPESVIVLNHETGKLMWDPDNIHCKRTKCPEPPPPPVRGAKEGSEREFGNSIKYTCPFNYEVVGKWKNNHIFKPIINPEFKCNPEGEWVPELPETFDCEPVHCPPLETPLNGYLQYSRVEGGIATYTCLDKTVTTRMCQADQTWSDQAPTCTPIHGSILLQFNLKWIIPTCLLFCLLLFVMVKVNRSKVITRITV